MLPRVAQHNVTDGAGARRPGARDTEVVDARRGRRPLFSFDQVDRLRHSLAKVRRSEVADPLWDCGGEEQRLQGETSFGSALVDRLKQLIDRVLEADVKHLVGLVENKVTDLRDVELGAIKKVNDTARGADHDVHPVLQWPFLLNVGHTAVDWEDCEAPRRDHLENFGDLPGELASRGEDNACRTSPTSLFQPTRMLELEHQLMDREDEAEGLARACPCSRDQIFPFVHVVEGRCLNLCVRACVCVCVRERERELEREREREQGVRVCVCACVLVCAKTARVGIRALDFEHAAFSGLRRLCESVF